MYTGYLSLLDTQIPLNACLVTIKNKCGKSNCKCSKGHFHQSTALKYRVNGIQKKKYVKKDDVSKVKHQLYSAKGGQILERDDKYIFAMFAKYDLATPSDYAVHAFTVFGQQKRTPESLLAN